MGSLMEAAEIHIQSLEKMINCYRDMSIMYKEMLDNKIRQNDELRDENKKLQKSLQESNVFLHEENLTLRKENENLKEFINHFHFTTRMLNDADLFMRDPLMNKIRELCPNAFIMKEPATTTKDWMED